MAVRFFVAALGIDDIRTMLMIYIRWANDEIPPNGGFAGGKPLSYKG